MALETEELWFHEVDFELALEIEATRSGTIRFAETSAPTLVISQRRNTASLGQGRSFPALQVQKCPPVTDVPRRGALGLTRELEGWHAHVIDWFHRHLGGADADPEALDAVYSVTR